MGKALLVLVLGSGLVLTQQLYSTQQNEQRTSRDQREYQEEVIAREIAASAFNVGMGEVRAHGEDVQVGARALNGADNAGRSGTYTTGRFTGGSYTVRAELTSGHSVRVIATGTFGEAEYTMHDEYRVYVMTVREPGIVDVSFLESQAGYCSAVYYQAYELGQPEGYEPPMIMLFAPDNRERGTRRPARLLWADGGTQLNFFIAVDQNCSTRPETTMSECRAREYARDNDLDLSDFDYVHKALLVESGNLDQAQEEIWAFVEQKPGKRNVWRIGWEDIHNTSWDRPDSNDPKKSLQALKTLGYDGVGWPDADGNQYRDLRDYGDRPDFSDQVIEVSVISQRDPSYQGKLSAYRAKQSECGEQEDELPEHATQEPVTNETPDEPAPDPDPEPEPSPEPDPEPEADDAPPPTSYGEFACSCKNNKYPVLHRPPGNESNEQLLCLPYPAVVTHVWDRRHNDVLLTCRR